LNHWSVVPEMPFVFRIEWRIWWLTVSLTVDRSRMRTEDLEAALASLRASVTVSAECPLLKPDWLLSRRLFCARKIIVVESYELLVLFWCFFCPFLELNRQDN